VQAQVAAEVHSGSGTRGALALRKRLPLSARAASQPPLVQTIETAFQLEGLAMRTAG
jgi:hypothetical protein